MTFPSRHYTAEHSQERRYRYLSPCHNGHTNGRDREDSPVRYGHTNGKDRDQSPVRNGHPNGRDREDSPVHNGHTNGMSNGRQYKKLSDAELKENTEKASIADQLIKSGKKYKDATLEASGWNQLFPLAKARDKHFLLVEKEKTASLEGRVTQLETQLAAAKKDARDWWHESERLQVELSRNKRKFAEIERSLEGCKTESSQLKAEKQKLAEKCAKLEADFNPLFNDYNDKTIALCETDEKIRELETTILGLQAELIQLNQKNQMFANMKELADEINAENEKLNSKLQEANHEIVALKFKMTQLEKEAAAHRGSANWESEKANLESQLQNLQAEKGDLLSTLKLLQSQMTEALEKIKSLLRESEAYKAEAESANCLYLSEKNEFSAAKEELAKLTTTHKAALQRHKARASELETVKQQLATSEAAQKSAEEKYTTTLGDLKRKVTELDSKETELRDERNKRQALESQLEKHMQLFTALQQQIANFCKPGEQ